MVTKKKQKKDSVIVIIVFFLFAFFLRLFHYFDYKTWAGNKKKKLEGVLIKSTWDSTAVAFAVLRPRFFLVKTFWFYDNHTTSK